MANLRVLFEKYIQLDDEIKKLNKTIDNSTNHIERKKQVFEYVSKLAELKDFESGIRMKIVKEFVNNDVGKR